MTDRDPDPLEAFLSEASPPRPEAVGAPCEKQGEALAFVDGSLPPDRARLVEEHLATCGSCRGAAIDYARALGGIESRSSVGPRRVARIVGLAVAAALVLAVGIAAVKLAVTRSASASVTLAFAATRDATAARRVGEGFHLEVRPRTSGHLHAALLYESDDTCATLVPAETPDDPAERLEPGIDRRFPEEREFVLADHPGDVAAVWLFTRRPLAAGEWRAFLEGLTAAGLWRATQDLASRHPGSTLSVERFRLER